LGWRAGVVAGLAEESPAMSTRALALAANVFVLGCSSTSNESANPDAGTTEAKLTFHENVEAILQDKCQTCHRPGGQGPFALITYDDVRKKAALIVDQMKTRSMPPWGAISEPECTPRHKLHNDLAVPQADIDVVAKWYEQGSLEGDPNKAPKARTFTDAKLTDPTHSAAINNHVVQPAARDEHVCFPLDPKITEEVFMEGFSVTPGNTKVVHHVLIYGDPNNEAPAKAGAAGYYPCFGGPGVSNTMILGAWVPGLQPTIYPPNVAMKLPKDLKLVMQMHYHPGAMPETDATKVELKVTTTPPSWEAQIRLIGNARSAPILQPGAGDPAGTPTFLIPAGAKDHVEQMVFTMPTIPVDVRIAAVSPHMHWAGKKLRAEIERPNPAGADPAKECLINAPNYDFNWQRGYAYNATVEELPRMYTKDKIKITCVYDNSMDNRHVAEALADAKKTAPDDVVMGEDTLNEMCLAGFTLYTRVR
jgi:hypothetical protein